MKCTKNNQYKTMLFAIVFAVSLLAGANAAQANLAVTFDRPAFENMGQVNDTTTLIGWSFTANSDLIVNRLGLWDWEMDVKPEHNHFVGLWDNSGRLLTSVTINELPAPAHPNTPWHMVDIGGYRLTAGTSYTVAAILGGDYYAYHTPQTLDPNSATVPFSNLRFNGVTYVSDAFAETNGVNFTNANFGSFSIPNGGVDGTVIGGFGPNMDVAPVPVPAAVYLLGSGLVGLIGIRRRIAK